MVPAAEAVVWPVEVLPYPDWPVDVLPYVESVDRAADVESLLEGVETEALLLLEGVE